MALHNIEKTHTSSNISVSVTGDIDRWFAYGLIVPIVMIPLNLGLGLLRYLDVSTDSALFSVLHYFDMGEELTFPSWFSAMILAIAAIASIAVVQRANERYMGRGFTILAIVMTYLSLDEATELHERTTDPLRSGLDLGGILYWSWVIPAGLAVILVGALLWRFVLTLPSSARVPLVVAGVLYVGTALGLELFEGLFFDKGGASAATDILSMIEEVGEMVAVMLYIRTTAILATSGTGGLEGNRFPSWRSAQVRSEAG